MGQAAEKMVNNTNTNIVVKKNIKIKASPTAVWRALTCPERTKKYFLRCSVFSDWQKGSDIQFKGKTFFSKSIEFNGKILQIEPEIMLKYTLKNENSNHISTVTDQLTYKNGYTTISITDDLGQGTEAKKQVRRSVKTWKKVLKGLKEVVEKERRAFAKLHL